MTLFPTASTAVLDRPPELAGQRPLDERASAKLRPDDRRPWGGRPPSLLHSAGFRFALVYALLLAASAAALAFYLWWATAGLLDRQTEAAIRADVQGLSERWNEGGLPALVLTIRERLEQDVDDDAIYLLVDQSLHPLAGNLRTWPAVVQRPDVLYQLPVTRAGAQALAQVQRYDLPGGYHLLIGRDVQARAKLRTLLTDALLWGAGRGRGDGAGRRASWCAACSAAPSPMSRPPPRRSRPAISAAGCASPAAATSSTSWPRRSTTCSIGSAG